MPSQTFEDLKGRKWTVAITVGDLRPVKARTGVELGKLADERCKLLLDLLADAPAFCDVLCVLLADQLKAADVSDIDFAKAIAGDPLESAADAFVEALALFCPSRLRGVIRTLASKGKAVQDLAGAKLIAAIEAIDPAEFVRTPSPSPGGSPDSSGSTPAG